MANTCNCINETTIALREKIKADIEKKTNVSEWIDDGHYHHRGFGMNGADSKIAMPFVATYIRQKVNGRPEKKETNITTYIYPTYCPFCGVKLK